MDKLVRFASASVPSLFIKPKEINRFRSNWLLVYLFAHLNGVTLFITAPSLHQFVTSSSNSTDPQVKPGLGLSETWYSLIVSAQSVGIVTGAVLFSAVARRVYHKFMVAASISSLIAGGLLYSFATHGLMVLIGRYLFGILPGVAQPLFRTYIGESSDRVIEMRQRTDPNSASTSLKYTNFFIMFLSSVTGLAMGPALEAIAGQIPGLDTFRWPGYYLIIHGSIVLTIEMLFFNEKWNDINRRDSHEKNPDVKSKKCCNFQRPVLPIYVIATLLFAFVVLGWEGAVIETVENPVLSDNFGLTIRYTSYIFILTLGMYTVANITTYVLQRLHFDNRNLLITGFIIGSISTAIIGDWQSLRGDPCNEISNKLIAIEEVGSGIANESLIEFQCQESNLNHLCSVIDNSTFSARCENASIEVCLCETLSEFPDYNCYWNQFSIVTGDFCERCRRVCLGRSRSLKFPQFLVGMCVFSFSIAFNRIIQTLLISDLTGKSRQGSGWLMGLLIASSGFAQGTGPLWANSVYLVADHRTWLVSSILTFLQLTLAVLFIMFYKQLKHKKVIVLTAVSEDHQELLQHEQIKNGINQLLDDDDENEETLL